MEVMMLKKSIVMALITVCIMVIAGCPGDPPPVASKTPATPPPPPAEPVVQEGLVLDGAANHTVVSGDTLAEIAANRYGGTNMYFFPLIRLANSGVVSDPDLIEPGTNLVVPQLQSNLNSVSANALVRAEMLRIASQYDRQEKPNAAARLRSLATRISK
jgi:PBP1b-binding outer membrane lipoprotein LpoB